MKRWRLCLLAALAALWICSGAMAQDVDGKLNINSATEAQLSTLPGFTPDLARKVVEKRKHDGDFVDLDELLDVDGMDRGLLGRIKDSVYVKPASDCNC